MTLLYDVKVIPVMLRQICKNSPIATDVSASVSVCLLKTFAWAKIKKSKYDFCRF